MNQEFRLPLWEGNRASIMCVYKEGEAKSSLDPRLALIEPQFQRKRRAPRDALRRRHAQRSRDSISSKTVSRAPQRLSRQFPRLYPAPQARRRSFSMDTFSAQRAGKSFSGVNTKKSNQYPENHARRWIRARYVDLVAQNQFVTLVVYRTPLEYLSKRLYVSGATA